jgi:cell wall assembly regulator SMI1
MRAASPNGNPTTPEAASMSVVTAGRGTSDQTTTALGTFNIPNTGGWHTFTWVPLVDAHGNEVVVTNSGAIKTLRVTTDNGGYNANFYELVPATPEFLLSAAVNGGTINISLPTDAGFTYQLQYKTNANDPAWLPLGNALAGNGTVQSFTDAVSSHSRCYRVAVH